jgi:hypothetical protein
LLRSRRFVFARNIRHHPVLPRTPLDFHRNYVTI